MVPMAASDSGSGSFIFLNLPENSSLGTTSKGYVLGVEAEREGDWVDLSTVSLSYLKTGRHPCWGGVWRRVWRGIQGPKGFPTCSLPPLWVPQGGPVSRNCWPLLTFQGACQGPLSLGLAQGLVRRPLGRGSKVSRLRAEICTFLARGWGALEAILGSPACKSPGQWSRYKERGLMVALCH